MANAQMMNILVVDDDPENRLLLKILMSSYGHCDMAVNGQEAVDAFRLGLDDGHVYDVVFLDIQMPVMNGQDALKRIRALESECGIAKTEESAIFMVTALDAEKQIADAFIDGGCTDYIIKPIMRDKLLNILRNYKLIDS